MDINPEYLESPLVMWVSKVSFAELVSTCWRVSCTCILVKCKIIVV